MYGEAVENHMNDATVDIGIVDNPNNPVTPVTGEALPVLGIVAFLDHSWSRLFTSSFGYSLLHIENIPQQDPDAFETGQYALGNLQYHPLPVVIVGVEVQYGKRSNFTDGFTSDDIKIQFSARYNFSHTFGGAK